MKKRKGQPVPPSPGAARGFQIGSSGRLPSGCKTAEMSRTSAPSPISSPFESDRATVHRVTSLSTILERVLPLLVLSLSVVSVPVMIFSPTGAPRLRALSEEKRRVDVEVSRLGDQIRRLRVEVRQLKSDPAKIERVARDELGLLRQTEIVVQFGG